jgi:hypothetical protein
MSGSVRRRLPRWLGALGLAVATAGCGQAAPSNLGAPPEWTAQLGGEGLQSPAAVVAGDDRIVLAGVYEEQFTLGERALEDTAGLDAVVMSMSPTGEVQWLRELAGGAGDDLINALAVGPAGDVFVAGQVSDGTSIAGRTLTAEGGGAALMAKLTHDGELAWAVTGRSGGFQGATAVAVAPDGAVYFAGDFSHDLDLGQGPLMRVYSDGDAFVARYSAAGALEWVTPIGGAGMQHVAGLAVGADGALTVVGTYVEELTIETQTLASNTITHLTPFAARLGAEGGLVWIQPALLPPGLNHIGHVPEGGHHSSHPTVEIHDVRVGVSPSGVTTVGITYGRQFSLTETDFEAPAIGSLSVTQLDAAGDVVGNQDATMPQALVFLSQLIARDDGARLILSWTGRLALPGTSNLDSDHRRSLAIVDVSTAGAFAPATTYGVPEVGLTVRAAAPKNDGSILAAVSWRDMDTEDEDIFLAAFR